MPRMTKQAIAESVMAYAEAHYEQGWDFVVECFSVADIVADMERNGYTTKSEIMGLYGAVRDVREDRIADAKNSAF
jgi:hypothetical protein